VDACSAQDDAPLSSTHSNDHLVTVLLEEIRRYAPDPDAARAIGLESTLPELGFDSLTLVDVIVAIEQRFGFGEFPVQQWADDEARKPGARFTVRSLADACARLVAAQNAS
jgi:acyl carrier protein